MTIQAKCQGVTHALRETPPLKGQSLFFNLAERYFDWLEKTGKHSAKERRRYKKHIHPMIGVHPAASVDRQTAEWLKKLMLATMTPASAKKCLGLCSAIIGHHNLSTDDMLLNPFSKSAGFQMPRVEAELTVPRYLQPEEVLLLLDALRERSLELHDMSYIALYIGLKETEIFNLRGRDFEPGNKILYVKDEINRRIAIHIDQSIVNILVKYKKDDDQYLFTSRNGERLKQVSDTFLRTAEDIGLSPPTFKLVDGKKVQIQRTGDELAAYNRQKVTFETLRHTFAALLASSGKYEFNELNSLLRNRNDKMTERYEHLLPENMKRDPLRIMAKMVNFMSSKCKV